MQFTREAYLELMPFGNVDRQNFVERCCLHRAFYYDIDILNQLWRFDSAQRDVMLSGVEADDTTDIGSLYVWQDVNEF